ncbi:MAG: insulinase family protein [Bdellovibrionales bacterium]|nr:insulinase family protein [Bdellovibrionales bacterium]
MKFKKTVLDNGIRVLSEDHADSRCVVVGYWIESGTRYESPQQVGISHLLEHMVFKGTEKYSAFELARCLEAVGGDINAFTAREHTCFHTTSLSEHMDMSVDVLSQLTAFAKFEPAELEKEKRVVQQEILMAADDLEEYAYDLFFEKVYPNHPLGYQILGSLDSVGGMAIDDIQKYYDQHFQPQKLIVTAAGCVDHQELVRAVESHLAGKSWSQEVPPQALPAPDLTTVRGLHVKDCEQYHILAGFPSCAYADENRFNGFVLNTTLGGGMTSKLYQRIREEKGLVYSIFSMLNTFTDSGLHTIYAGTERNHVEEVIDLILKELREIKMKGITEEEVQLYKTQAKGQIIIASEDIDSRMNSLAVNEMVFGKYREVDEVIADIEKVNRDSVMDYIQQKLDIDKMSLFVLGPQDSTIEQYIKF